MDARVVHRRPRRCRHHGRDAGGGSVPRGASMQLLVDVGTNAEIVLGDRSRVFAPSSPTGPAFDPALSRSAAASAARRQAPSSGCASTGHARAAVQGHRDRRLVRRARRSPPAVTGVCGSAIIDAIAQMFLAGVIDADGMIRPRSGRDAVRVVPDGRTFAYVLHDDGATAAGHHPERRPGDPARQGRAAGGDRAAARPRRAS